MSKQRLSASVSADLIHAAERAVAEGRAESVSAWVDEAMRRQVEHDERMRALGEFISAWEADHGAITEAEMAAAVREARQKSIVVRHGTLRRPSKSRSAGAARAPRAKGQPARKIA